MTRKAKEEVEAFRTNANSSSEGQKAEFCGQAGRKHTSDIRIGDMVWEPNATPSDKAALSMRLSYNNELMCAWAAVRTLVGLETLRRGG
ncbi:MAG: hypothetical protein Q7T16_03455 [Candidatus Burarchaeum sp.]|nr:hypothetical protein [Candidatus Burarchaeum sp.]MDO8339688.1 hypothetical protein [Candidatus Burarchaeum sp.]